MLLAPALTDFELDFWLAVNDEVTEDPRQTQSLHGGQIYPVK
jgi:hypothetical protein